jgi:hypothetical protein
MSRSNEMNQATRDRAYMALVRLYYDQQGIKVKIGVDEHEKKDNQRHIVDSSLCANGERIND